MSTSFVKSNQALIASLRCAYPQYQKKHDYWLAQTQGELTALVDLPRTKAEKRAANRRRYTLRRLVYAIHWWIAR